MIPPLRGDGQGVQVAAGLDATVQTALLDIGVVGWTVPALALGVPGMLVVIVVALQLVGGAAWVPISRRILSRTSRADPAARSVARQRERRTRR